MEDFDKYLSGKLSAEERHRLEEKIAADPALQAELRVREGLRQLRLQRKVNEVAQTRQEWYQSRRWRPWLGIAAAVLLVGMAVFVFWKKGETPMPEVPPMQQMMPTSEPAQPAESEPVTPISPKAEEKGKTPPPIAQRPNTVDEQPLLRSAYEDLDAFTLQLLDSLLMQTRRLPQKGQAKADKSWKRAVQLLAVGQPNEAKMAIFQLEKTDAEEARWLLGLALLAQGKSEEAEAVFEKIASQTGHPRQAAARATLEKIKE